MSIESIRQSLRETAVLYGSAAEQETLKLASVQIAGRLMSVVMLRQAQSIAICCVVIGLLFYMWLSGEHAWPGGIAMAAAGFALLGLVAARFAPVYTAREPMCEGMIALSRYELKNPDLFVERVSTLTDLTSNKAITAICRALYMDDREKA